MGLVRIADPFEEPVSLAEAKAHLRVEHSDEDALISALIKAAREYAEAAQNRQLVTALYEYTIDNNFPTSIELPRPPLQSVTSIKYVDMDGDTQTVAASVYTVDTAPIVGRIVLAYNQAWPSTRTIINAVTVTYTAGYASAALVPSATKQAMLLLISHWYDNRNAASPVELKTVPMAVASLLVTDTVITFL